jgi:hypothetical protein
MFNLTDYADTVQMFFGRGAADFQTWSKPANAKFVNIFCLGSGGGGGAGQGAGLSTARRGGGSGGAAGYSTGLFAATQLPDTLYIQVPIGGAGGIGGVTNANGSAGGLSYVSVEPNTTAINLLMVSGAAAAGGGNSGGAASSAGAAGAAGTIWAGGILNNLGLVTASAGQIGIAGITLTAPTAVVIGNIVTSGGAGAGTNGATPLNGGNITGAGFINTITGGTGNASTAGSDGSGGLSFDLNPNSNRFPVFFTGGAGGGSSNSAAGGNGGVGSYGCGGGGGGAGLTNLGGNGGAGGSGLIIITSW